MMKGPMFAALALVEYLFVQAENHNLLFQQLDMIRKPVRDFKIAIDITKLQSLRVGNIFILTALRYTK